MAGVSTFQLLSNDEALSSHYVELGVCEDVTPYSPSMRSLVYVIHSEVGINKLMMISRETWLIQ